MTTKMKIILTALVGLIWLTVLVPYTVAGVLTIPVFAVVVLATVVVLVLIWNPKVVGR